jgi:hypothetical protein
MMQAKIERDMCQTIKIGWIVGGYVWLILTGQSVFAALSAAPVTTAGPGSPQSVTTSDETSIDALRREVAELRRKIEKPPKDLWDKFASVSGFASGLAVALIGFYATNVYNRQQQNAEEHRKDQTVRLAESKFNIEKERFDHERQKWREELSNQVTLKLLEARLVEYSSLWSRIELVARHRMGSGELTQSSARELASDVETWRYSKGGLLAEPVTRDAAFAFQRAAWNFDGTKESYKRIRDARRILRDALRADMGVDEVFGTALIDQAAARTRTKADLAKLQDGLGISPEADS